MNGIESLLSRRMIIKAENKELYYKVRDNLGEIRKFATEKLGCQIIENALLIKLEKIPAAPEPFMGISEFDSKEEYAFFCILLMFLEDKERSYQFVLSQVTEFIASNMPGETVDWTLFINRRRLVRVLRYAVKQGILQITDGRDDIFMDDITGEVLYENTGVSRYFMRNFSQDIMEYEKPEDFQESEWFDVNEDRGAARRQRVYKRLLFSPGMYQREGSAEDFQYLKYYGNRMRAELEEMFDCQIHIHRGSAFLLSGEDCRMGETFPGNNTLSDILLLCFYEIRKCIETGSWSISKDEVCQVDQILFEKCMKGVKQKYGSGFSKQYREMTESEFVEKVTEEMRFRAFIKYNEEEHQVLIYPIIGKIQGQYPGDYKGDEDDKQMAGK